MTSFVTVRTAANRSRRQLKLGSRRMLKVTLILCGLCIALLFIAILQSEKISPKIPPNIAEQHIREWLRTPPVFQNDNGSYTRLYHLTELRKLYRSNRNQLIWFDHYQLAPQALLLVQSLRETVADDRYRYSYHLPAILQALNRLSNKADDVTALDLLLSEAYVTFAQDSLNKDFLPDLNAHDHAPYQTGATSEVIERITTDEVIYQLQQNLDTPSLVSLIESLTPTHSGYLKLRQKLEYYQKLAVTPDNWVQLPNGFILRMGDAHEDVIKVRKLLTLYGDYQQVSKSTNLAWRESSDFFDEELSIVLKHYQARMGLIETGELNKETRARLQESPERIARRIAFNMKRWRHLPEELGSQYIFINMADFKLEYRIDNQIDLSMKVIVGRPDRRTPTLIENLSTLSINPSWTIPQGVASKQVFPKVVENINYLSDMAIDLYRIDRGKETLIDPFSLNWSKLDPDDLPFWFRQQPGNKNALGRVKFNMPNPMSIYMHDTNHPELFDQNIRALSSGCVRLERPKELANRLLLQKDQWDQNRVDTAFDSGRTYNIKLQSEIPVYLLYLTAWVDENEQLQQRQDIYHWDQLDRIGSDEGAKIMSSGLIDLLSP